MAAGPVRRQGDRGPGRGPGGRAGGRRHARRLDHARTTRPWRPATATATWCPARRCAGASLADLLLPEEDTPVPAARIKRRAALHRHGRRAVRAAAVVTGADGRYAHGVTAGAHHKEHAEYIGATARARRRAARIAACAARIGELDNAARRAEPAGRRAGGTVWPRFAEALCGAAAHRRDRCGAARARTGRWAAARRAGGGRPGPGKLRPGGRRRHGHRAGTAPRRRRSTRWTPSSWTRSPTPFSRFEATAGQLTGRRREEARQRGVRRGSHAPDATTPLRNNGPPPRPNARLAAGTPRRPPSWTRCAARSARRPARWSPRIEEAEAGITGAERAENAARAAEREAHGCAAAEARERLAAGRQALDVAAAEERARPPVASPRIAARELLDVLKCPPGLAWPAQQADWAGDRACRPPSSPCTRRSSPRPATSPPPRPR